MENSLKYKGRAGVSNQHRAVKIREVLTEVEENESAARKQINNSGEANKEGEVDESRT